MIVEVEKIYLRRAKTMREGFNESNESFSRVCRETTECFLAKGPNRYMSVVSEATEREVQCIYIGGNYAILKK